VSFDQVCRLLGEALDGPFRGRIVADLASIPTLGAALARLREPMQTHRWKTDGTVIDLGRAIATFDARTRQEGFHVLHDWDGKADAVNPDPIAVDVLDFVARTRGDDPRDDACLAILVDYGFMNLLALLSLRLWDEGDADRNLDRLDGLLHALQGPGGSGQRFADDAATLLLIATAHYERDERGYDLLLDRTRRLNDRHRLRIALGHSASMGCHLRFGFEATYAKDTGNMRDDNVADYPWLCFAVATLMDEYVRLTASGVDVAGREGVVEALGNGLCADVGAFLADRPPDALAACESERSRFQQSFRRHAADLIPELERHRPTEERYSPLSFFFNFSHNVVKGSVVDALLWGEPWDVSLDDLLTGLPRDAERARAKESLAKTLMGYARANPDRIRGRLMPVIVYDPQAGRRAFGAAVRRLADGTA
jgi:hypothetical protein